MTGDTRPAAVAAAFAVIYLVWGSTYLAIRIGLETLPPFLLAGTRFLLAGGLLYGWLRLRGMRRPTDREWWASAGVGLLMLVGGVGTVTWAEQRIDSGVAALLIATVPLWVALLDRLGGRGGIRPRAAAGLVLGLAGVSVLAAPELGGIAQVDRIGAVAVVAAALSWSLGTVLSRGCRLPDSPAMTVAIGMVVAGGVLLFVAGAVGEWRGGFALSEVSGRSAAALAYLTVAGSILTLCCYSWLLRRVAAPAVASYAFVNPVVAVALGWWVLSEPVGPRVLLSGGLIVVAVVLVQSTEWGRRAAPEASASVAPGPVPRRFRLAPEPSLAAGGGGPARAAAAARWVRVLGTMQLGVEPLVSGRSQDLNCGHGGCDARSG